MNTQEMGELMTIFERFVKLFGSTNGERSVVHEGEHFRVTELPAPTRSKQLPFKKARRQKNKTPYGEGKPVMNMAVDPNVWPFENERGVGPKHKRSKAIQKTVKKILTGSSPVSRTDLFKLVKMRMSSALRKELDVKGRLKWQMTLGALLRNYSLAGYIVRVKDSDPDKEMYTLAK